EREFRNEVLGFTTGEPDDILFSSIQWGVAPEAFFFSRSFQDTLSASAIKVDLPPDFWQKGLPLRKALFFRRVLEGYLPVKILDGELIVGSYFNTALSKTLNRAETKRWKKREKKWFRKSLYLNAVGIGNCGAIPGHLIPDYPAVLQKGFKGLAEEFRSRKEGAGAAHREFLEALIQSVEAVPGLSSRYADEALRLAEEEPDPARKAELEEIARICRKVPWEPAETFHEALQALWFTHMLVMACESYPGPGLSPGRVDQYLYPYYRADLDQGRLTRDEARELLQCWFIKHNYAYDFMGRVGTNQGINSGFGQLITLGGMGPDGEDRSNDLTLLFLEVIEQMNLLEPKPNIRLHQNISESVLDKVVDLVAKAQGSPFLMNFDEISMRALEWAGLPKEDLWNYAPVGCLENTLQGNDRSGTVDVNLNLAKPVELAMNKGRDARIKYRVGKRTASPESMKTYREFQDAYLAQLEKLLGTILDMASEADAIRAEFEPTPFLSALVKGCAEKGKDVTAGGPEYNFITVEGVAFATAVDSLAAVKKLVFDEGKIKMSELSRALKKNFKGHEPLRQMLLNRAPKYGNDDPEVDRIARDVNHFFSETVIKRTSPATGRRFRSGYLSWNYWILYAAQTGATPDGRKRGTYLSNGVCPTTGCDHKGPVSVARSVHNMDLEVVPNGGSHTISFNPHMARTEKGRRNLKAFLKAYGREGGSALQINMIDPETLKDAQKRPDQYRNLLVRVTGYNAYFTTLGREIQDEIISRESFRLGGSE
ncbi:MAG: pyruvate formate lyase family protein, partial [bacterium]